MCPPYPALQGRPTKHALTPQPFTLNQAPVPCQPPDPCAQRLPHILCLPIVWACTSNVRAGQVWSDPVSACCLGHWYGFPAWHASPQPLLGRVQPKRMSAAKRAALQEAGDGPGPTAHRTYYLSRFDLPPELKGRGPLFGHCCGLL